MLDLENIGSPALEKPTKKVKFRISERAHLRLQEVAGLSGIPMQLLVDRLILKELPE